MGASTNKTILGAGVLIVAVGLVIAILLVALNATGMIGGGAAAGSITQKETIKEIVKEAGTNPIVRSTGDLNVNVAAKSNTNTTSDYYTASTLVLFADNAIQDTDTGTAAVNTPTLTAMTAPASPRNGKIIAKSSTALGSNVVDYAIPETTGTVTVIVPIAEQSAIQTRAFDITGANTSSPNAVATTQTESAATAMSSGDSRTVVITYKTLTGKTAYGGPKANEGVLWGVDTVDSAAFSSDAVVCSSSDGAVTMTNVPCGNYPKAQAKDSLDKCYITRAILAADGEKEIRCTINNDMGSNAGASSDPILYIEDLQYNIENGVIYYDAFDSGGNQLGVGQSKFTFDNS